MSVAGCRDIQAGAAHSDTEGLNLVWNLRKYPLEVVDVILADEPKKEGEETGYIEGATSSFLCEILPVVSRCLEWMLE